MICLACERKDVRYPVIDRWTDATACPYCRALDSLVPGEGETEESIKELRKFAEEQGWRFMMQVKDTVMECKPDWIKEYTPVMYTVLEGGMFQVALIRTDVVDERIQKFKDTGVLTIDSLDMSKGWPTETTEDIVPKTVVVTQATEYLVKMKTLAQVEVESAERVESLTSEGGSSGK